MSKILVNDTLVMEGRFSFETSYERRDSLVMTEIQGMISLKKYLPDIHKIENDRYCLNGIFVYKESYGSEEDEIIYHFVAKNYSMAKRLQEVKENG